MAHPRHTDPRQYASRRSVTLLSGEVDAVTDTVDTVSGRVTPDQWNDLRVPFNSVKVGALKPPTFAKWNDNGFGSDGVYGWSFSATQENEVFFDTQLPHTYKEGSRLAPHCHFIPLTSPTVGQTVRFGLEYTHSNVDGVFPPTSIIYAEYTFVPGDALDQQFIGGFEPDIEDELMHISAMISCRFFRDATHANDTYTGAVIVLEFDFHHLVESFGSINEFSKT